jgi:hypothetical protein
LLGSLALPLGGGCASLLGEETFEAYFYVGKGSDDDFGGWTEKNLDEAPDPDQEAILKRVLLRAPDGVKDLTFIKSLFVEVVQPDKTRTPMAQATSFPANDTMAPLDILYEDNLRPLLYPDGRKIRFEWSGTFDTSYPYPDGGLRVDALITIEIL